MCHTQATLWNNEKPDPFYIFLSGGGGVGKSFLVKLIAEYCRRMLQFDGQKSEQPSIILTASTGKAGAEINGVTLHSAFSLKIKLPTDLKGDKQKCSKLHEKYRFLKIIILDEISMISDDTFIDFSVAMQDIMGNDEDFGGVSVIASGDFLQLPPVGKPPVFSDLNEKKAPTYSALDGNLWRKRFKLVELTKIVRQASDPDYASILSRVREGKQNEDDIKAIMDLHNTDTSSWPEGYIRLYLSNALATTENRKAINAILEPKFTFTAKDLKRDKETGVCAVHVPKTEPLRNTANLPRELTLCKGTRFMLTINLDQPDKLVNGAIGTIAHISVNSKKLLDSILYVKFDSPKVGNSKKNSKLPAALRDTVPIKCESRTFRLKGLSVQRKQFPGIAAHAITVHKSQGGQFSYMMGDFNQKSSATSSRMGTVKPGQAYTMLSRAKGRTGIVLRNFLPKHIISNKKALEEMERLRQYALLDYQHPLSGSSYANGVSIMLLNIRNWNAHEHQLFTDDVFVTTLSIMFFTETHTQLSGIETTKWKDEWILVHIPSEHGFAIAYRESIITLSEVNLVHHEGVEAVTCNVMYENKQVSVFLVYRKPGTTLDYVRRLQTVVERCVVAENLLILGDFNMDQRDYLNVQRLRPIIQEFSTQQRITVSTHQRGGILDLIFDTGFVNTVNVVPTPYSDHFSVFAKLD